MKRQSLTLDNLGDVLGAAKNAARLGTQQFETPAAMAAALCLPLTPCRPVVADLNCGHGSLAAAAVNPSTRTVLGLDIDPTATALPRGWRTAQKRADIRTSVIHGDVQRIAPLLGEVQWKADLLVLNPPFSLRWQEGDSTLVMWRLAHRHLTRRGEGLFLCNEATARRLIASTPEAAKIWLWVTVPNFFPGTRMDSVAALYFAGSHKGEKPLEFTLPTADAGMAARALEQFTRSRDRLISGDTIGRPFHAYPNTTDRWEAVAAEWKRERDAEIDSRDGWNIRLDRDGRLDVWLTPFQNFSGKVPRPLVEELQGIHGKHPAALVVQKPSRLALQRAVGGGVWRVEPRAAQAVADAVRDYQRVRAPFIRLKPTQRLGFLDEEDALRCAACLFDDAGREIFTAGRTYALATETFEGRKEEIRPRLGHDDESVLVSGQELAILLTDECGLRRCFTQFAPTSEDEGRPLAESHHLLSELIEHFEIPDVPDVTALHPQLYETMKARLHALENA